MTISIDRNSKLFTPEMSDRINKKSTDLYENIQALDVPEKAFKEKVAPIYINTQYDIEQHCYSIGRTQILSFKVRQGIPIGDSFKLFGTVMYQPVADIIWLASEKALFKIPANKNEIYIYPFDSDAKDYWVYIWYIN